MQARVDSAISACEAWYSDVRKNAPWWIGWGLSYQQLDRLWPFVHPWGAWAEEGGRNIPARSESLAVLRQLERWKEDERVWTWINWNLYTPPRRAIKLIEERSFDLIQLHVQRKFAELAQEWSRIGHDSDLVGPPHSHVGPPPRYTTEEKLALHHQAAWLASKVRAFDARDFVRRFGVAEGDAWIVRFPMLEPDLVATIRTARLPNNVRPKSRFNGIADRMVTKRSRDTIAESSMKNARREAETTG